MTDGRLRLPGLAVLSLFAMGVPISGGGGLGAQGLGHRIPGVIGIDAGVQGPAGLSLLYRFLYYQAGTLRDRHGDEVPIRGLDLDAVVNAFGISFTIQPRGWPYLGAAFAAPLADISIESVTPRTGINRFGFADIYIQPLKVGWRFQSFDLVASYALYAPTGRFSLTGEKGAGSGAWSHQISLGGAVFLDPLQRRRRGSLLVSYFLNHRKRGVDIRRGSFLQLQGGAALLVVDPVTVGVSGYALWQTTDDSGSELPPPLRGARDRVFGLGPEIVVVVPALRSRLEARYEWDFGVRSRPQGSILVVGLTALVWQPRPPARR